MWKSIFSFPWAKSFFLCMCVCSQDSYPRYLKSDLYKNMLAKAIVPQETKKRWHFYTHPTFFSSLSIFKHAFNERIFLFSFPSVCSPSWDARGTLAPPLLRLPPRQQRKKALPRGQVPTLQLARISDPGQKKRTQKREKDSVALLSVVWVFSLKSNRASRTPQQHH